MIVALGKKNEKASIAPSSKSINMRRGRNSRMMHLGVECREIGDCLFICGTTQDRDMIQQYWLLPIESESSTDDSGLPEL